MGFLDRGTDGSYSLGHEFHRLASLAGGDREHWTLSREAANVIRPVVRTLAAGTQETASFYVRNGRRRICLFRQNSPREVRHHIDEGGRKSLRIGAGSKVIRAFSKHSRDPTVRTVRIFGWAMSMGERTRHLPWHGTVLRVAGRRQDRRARCLLGAGSQLEKDGQVVGGERRLIEQDRALRQLPSVLDQPQEVAALG